ncbi:endothelin-3 [Hippoglossus hippoglossus]|uniref:endothelin-3 n=1 Tax=Hippoglossus hippoglossus TaxID=8267 RepID=UPI00148BCA56|nr:endothelin-3 [Hippoglossus hippoglossus]
MANVSSVDVGVLFLIVVTASLANGSSSSNDVSQRKEVEPAKLDELVPGGVDDLASVPSPSEVNPCPACEPPRPRKRAKRCTCYTYKDKECVYYCHLDIIWINTPEHTVLYGMSSYQGSLRMRRSAGTEKQRRRRRDAEAQRCVCARRNDSDCSSFCMNRQRRQLLEELKIHKRRAALRSGPTMKRTNSI